MTTHVRSATELATEMTNLLAGFQISHALYAVAKLDIPAALLDGPRPVTDLATQTQVDPDLLRRILHVLTGQGVFTHAPDDAIALTELGATLATGTTGSVRGLAMFWMQTHYQPFSALLDVLRTGRTGTELVHGQTFVEFLGDHPEHIPSLTAAMADMTSGPQSEILSGYRLPPGTVADIGGADGSVLVSLIADEPDRQAIVFDLPDVVESARTRIADTDLTGRIRTIGGDFFESVPKADVYLLATVLHDWNDEDSLCILRKHPQRRASRRPRRHRPSRRRRATPWEDHRPHHAHRRRRPRAHPIGVRHPPHRSRFQPRSRHRRRRRLLDHRGNPAKVAGRAQANWSG